MTRASVSFLYAVSFVKRVDKQGNVRGIIGKNYKKQGNYEQGDKATFFAAFGAIKPSAFGKVGNPCRDKKDADIDKIGRFAEDTVIGVKYNGDKDKSQGNTFQFDTPEIFTIGEKTALQKSKEKHRKKQ